MIVENILVSVSCLKIPINPVAQPLFLPASTLFQVLWSSPSSCISRLLWTGSLWFKQSSKPDDYFVYQMTFSDTSRMTKNDSEVRVKASSCPARKAFSLTKSPHPSHKAGLVECSPSLSTISVQVTVRMGESMRIPWSLTWCWSFMPFISKKLEGTSCKEKWKNLNLALLY